MWGAKGLVLTFESNPQGIDLNDVIENNTIEAIVNTTDPDYYADAVALEDVGTNCSPLFLNNVFESNDISLELGDGDGWPELDGDFVSDTFSQSSDGTQVPYTTITAGYWIGGVQNVQIIDPSYAAGSPNHHLVQLRLAQRRLQPHARLRLAVDGRGR